MKWNVIFRHIIDEKGVTQASLARRINAPKPSVYERLTHDNISIKKLNEMLKVIDYKLVIMPADKRLGEEEYEIE